MKKHILLPMLAILLATGGAIATENSRLVAKDGQTPEDECVSGELDQEGCSTTVTSFGRCTINSGQAEAFNSSSTICQQPLYKPN